MKAELLSRMLVLLPLLLPMSAMAENSETGSWTDVIPMEIVPVAVANLPNGNLLTWSARDRYAFGGNLGRTYTSIFDPYNLSSSTVVVSNTQHDMFCPGISNLPDGRVLVNGGSGNDQTSLYNPVTDLWESGDKMNTVRGYQGNVTLSDGSVFTVGGSWSGARGNKNAEVWTEATGWVAYPEITADETVRDGSEIEPQGNYRDDNHAWLWAAPNGKIFHAGPSQNMHWIDPDGEVKVTAAGTRGSDPYSMNGTTVMYDIGKILKVGGAQAYGGGFLGSKRAHIIDINQDTPAVEEVQNTAYNRTLHSSVVLPNGEVFLVGGMKNTIIFSDLDAVLTPELWNPETKTWKQLSAMAIPRTYHSTAILLNDGRVFVGGGGLCGTCTVNHPDAEIYSPPYLFVDGTDTLATRPVINSAPSTANYDSYINVLTNSAVTNMSLLRASSATHSVNNEQRRIPLTFDTNAANNYSVKMPSRNLAPPGNYMLFVMNAAGVPSVSKVVLVGSAEVKSLVTDGDYWLESPSFGERLTSQANNQTLMAVAGTQDTQKWSIRHLGDRIYTLQNVASGRYLEVENSACANLSVVSSATTDVGDNRRWVMTRNGDSFNFRPLHCKTQSLDREAGRAGAAAISYTFQANHTPQLWNVTSAGAVAPYPVAITETVSTPVNTALTIDVLSNDIGSGLTISSVNDWTENAGRASVVNNQISYTPDTGFAGTDAFWYVIADSQGRSNSVRVIVEVTGEGSPNPVGVADNATTLINTTITIDVLANDIGSGLTIPELGAWSLKGGSLVLVNNQVQYSPAQDFTGEDKLWYNFADSQGRTNYGEVTINVEASTDAAYPVAVSETVNTPTNTPITIDVLANDTGLGLSILEVNAYAVNGGTVIQSGSRLIYTPASNYSGQDSFWYAVTDSLGRANAIQVFVNVGS
ncbi:Ig-like domain-containing protein [Leucothrix arctica]|uniref:Uncharacterized protein n=1 Tax=Leucothrix arctica TaxID=1481894 RepID=A0A317C8V8_9GAMM|nr:tandem-95 repeat protein [Leucothrix arctica]PWQ94671.1 hypothetical protein DKT75_15370 [Leucothrix arctica]